MKTNLFIAFITIALASCVQTKTQYAIINGHYQGNAKGMEIHLCKAEHGEITKVATTSISEAGDFGFNYPITNSGLYVVNIHQIGNARRVYKDHNLKRFYLEKGTQVDINVQEGSYTLLRTNSDKNKLLSSWNQQIDTLFTYSHGFLYHVSDYKTFFPLLPGYVQQGDEFKQAVNTGDQSFDELMKLIVEVDLNRAALMMVSSPRPVHPKREDYPEYFDYILAERAPQSERILELPGGQEFMRSYAMYGVSSQPQNGARTNYYQNALEHIHNDLLKGYYAVENIKAFKSYDRDYLGFKAMIEPYLSTDYLKERVKAHELTIRKFETGADAFDFTGTDVNGKEHKLSDYKGNLVYVDVWATWCAPCKGQLPALKELEKKFHNKPITFLSISLDEPKSRKKWEKFVKEEQLKGVQLMADKAFDSDVAKVYGINAIPRFMLFDKNGKVITTDAPRPVEKTTEGYLRSLL